MQRGGAATPELPGIFVAIDSALAFLSRRRQQPTFANLRDSVERSVGRDFTERHLAQVLAVLPEAYSLSYVLCTKSADDDDRTFRRRPVLVVEMGAVPRPSGETAPSVGDRRAAFDAALRALAVDGAEVAPCWSGFPSSEDFAQVAQRRSRGVKRRRVAAGASAGGAAALGPQAREAGPEEAPGEPNAESEVESATRAAATSAAPPPASQRKRPKQKGLGGLPPGLLERVRRREQRSESVRGVEAVAARKKRSAALSLPRFFDLLVTHLRTSDRSAFAIADIAGKLSRSSPPTHPLSPREAAQRLQALAKAAPEWCEVVRSEHSARQGGAAPKIFRTKERSRKSMLKAASVTRDRLVGGAR